MNRVKITGRGIVLALLLGVALSTVLILVKHEQAAWDAAAPYFAEALQAGEVSETVFIRGREYQIEKGRVTSQGKEHVPADEWKALSVAYQLALARRTPLFDISGTDPSALFLAVQKLSDTQQELALRQETYTDKSLVTSLYPIAFLRSLASLEEARQRFLSEHTDTAAQAYEYALEDVLQSQKRYLRTFSVTMSRALEERAFRFPGFGGTITSASVEQSLQQVAERLQETEGVLHARKRCFDAAIYFCNPNDILISALPVPAPVSEGPDVIELREDVRSILREAGVHPYTEVRLSSSACVSLLPAPYYFSVPDSDAPSGVPPRFVNDLFFTATEEKKGLLGYAKENFSVSFFPANPTIFYHCPELWADAGRMYAILETRKVALKYPSVAEKERDLFLSTVLDESAAIRYVNAAFKESEGGMADDFLELMHMFRNGSAHMDRLVTLISSTQEKNLRLSKKGAPISIAAHELILTHSAFPSLLLTHNHSAGRTAVAFRVREEDPAYLGGYLRYSKVRGTASRGRMIQDIRSFRILEGFEEGMR